MLFNKTWLFLSLQFSFEIPLSDEINLDKCKKLWIKGFNKVGVSSDVSVDMKSCHVDEGPRQVIPKIVIDAVGEQDSSEGKIALQKNI
jgi:hypothetical protein